MGKIKSNESIVDFIIKADCTPTQVLERVKAFLVKI